MLVAVSPALCSPSQMRKVEELAQRLHRQQVREAKRLRGRLEFAATVIQRAARKHVARVDARKQAAAIAIQRLWRGVIARQYYVDLQLELIAEAEEAAASVIARSTRRFICRRARLREHDAKQQAAFVIQGGFRVSVARRQADLLREKRGDRLRRERAAVVIQATARSFVTRLIYLNVLFLICRIQAVARGFLVRRWCRQQCQLAEVESAVVTLQAHARGFCVRKRRRHQEAKEEAVSPSSSTPSISAPPSIAHRKAPTQREAHVSEIVPPVKKTPSLRTPAPDPPPTIKRSYWLPAGASFNKRLPVVLSPTTPGAAGRIAQPSSSDGSTGNGDAELVRCLPKQAPRRRPHTRPRPGRLSPVMGGAARSPTSRPSTRTLDDSSDADEVARKARGNMQRLEREAEAREHAEQVLLRQKEKQLQERQARRERRRQQMEAQSKREGEEVRERGVSAGIS